MGRSPLSLVKLLPRPVERHTARRYSTFNLPISVDNAGPHGKLDNLSLMYRPETIGDFILAFGGMLREAAVDPHVRRPHQCRGRRAPLAELSVATRDWESNKRCEALPGTQLLRMILT